MSNQSLDELFEQRDMEFFWQAIAFSKPDGFNGLLELASAAGTFVGRTPPTRDSSCLCLMQPTQSNS
jgi:hypothetical protein